MKSVVVSASLPDMLREYLDQVTSRKTIPKEDIQDWVSNDGKNLTQDQRDAVEQFICRVMVEYLMEKKEHVLITPAVPIDEMMPLAENTLRLEDFYAYKLVALLPDIVRRSQQLTLCLVKQPPTPKVAKALREACLSFLYGRFVGCLCICRFVLEDVLKQRLEGKPIPLHLFKKKSELEGLIEWAADRKILMRDQVQKAHIIRKAGNRAVHDHQASEEEALAVLNFLQNVLTCLYKD